MKKAFLWLGPLACLALASLYAYAWYNRDPLEVAFERVQIGMGEQEAHDIIRQRHPSGKQPRDTVASEDASSPRTYSVWIWTSDEYDGELIIQNGHVESKCLYRRNERTVDRIGRWMHALSFWSTKGSPPPPPPFPGDGGPDYDHGVVALN
jgi:hypothetical protein